MPSDKQIDANCQNAKRSTGPRTMAGRARSSRNSFKHGLTADQVVIWDEDPAAFESLRDYLNAHFRLDVEWRPTDPVAEILVDQLAAHMWRLRRVPQIEAGIYSHFRHLRERTEATKRVDAQVEFGPDVSDLATIKDKEAHALAKRDQKRAEAELQGDQSVLGEVFAEAERSLNNLLRIAGTIENSMHRTIHELNRIRAEREERYGWISIDYDEDPDDEDVPLDLDKLT